MLTIEDEDSNSINRNDINYLHLLHRPAYCVKPVSSIDAMLFGFVLVFVVVIVLKSGSNVDQIPRLNYINAFRVLRSPIEIRMRIIWGKELRSSFCNKMHWLGKGLWSLFRIVYSVQCILHLSLKNYSKC